MPDYEERESIVEERATTAVSVRGDVPCLGGCGALVGPGQKCPACATLAVYAYYARVEQRRIDEIAERAKMPLPNYVKPRAPSTAQQQGTRRARGRKR